MGSQLAISTSTVEVDGTAEDALRRGMETLLLAYCTCGPTYLLFRAYYDQTIEEILHHPIYIGNGQCYS